MDSKSDSNSPIPQGCCEEVYRAFKDSHKCSEEDLRFQFTDEQLKEICLKRRCRVMASRWNIVYEYGLWLRKEGRFVGKTAKYERAMVTKGVNRHKSILMYDQNEIEKSLKTEWLDRKKDNILSVRLWEYDRRKNDQDQEDKGTESILDISETSVSENPIRQNLSDSATNSFSFNGLEEDSLRKQSAAEEDINYRSTHKHSNNLELSVTIETDKDTLPNTNYNNDVYNIFNNADTESMSIVDTITQTQSQDIFTEDFEVDIPMTSTQRESQNTES